jgi:hypothetical protein
VLEILNDTVYMAALAVAGFGLWLGVFAGRAPPGITLIPAIFGTAVIVIVVRGQRWWRRAAALPRALRSGLGAALVMVRRRDPSLLGVLAGWGFDIAAQSASFEPLATRRRARCS